MQKLLMATNNSGKMAELQALLNNLKAKLVTPAQIGLHLDVVEDGQTYQENALKKAQAFAEAAQICTLADDSGLEVAAINGQPGLYSARFAPQPGATDADRRAYLLEQLKGHPRPWKAQFRCWVAVVTPEGAAYFAEGTCPGEIIPTEKGGNGFGYDPIFQVENLGQTMAELSGAQKNRLSHRARAVQAIYPTLKSLVGD